MERKYLAAIAGFIGFVSGAISLVQFYSFTQIQKIKLEYDPSGTKNNLFEFIYDLNENIGNIVILDFSMPVGKQIPGYKGERHPFYRSLIDKKSVGWHFDECSFALEVNRITNDKRECAYGEWNESETRRWNETIMLFNKHFSGGRIPYDKLNIPDNGLAITLEGSGQTINPFSSLQIEAIEGGDMAYGPFQVSSSMDDAAGVIRISPAPYTKELSAQVKCAEKDWPYLMKFFVCPFL